MKRSVWIVIPTVNNSYCIIALVAVSVLVTEGNVSGNVSISECEQSGGQAHRQGHIPGDGQPVNFTCENIPINEAVFWALKPSSIVTVSFRCNRPSQRCETNNPDFQVSRSNETSVLTVIHNHQTWLENSTVVCSVGDGRSNFYTCSLTFTSVTASAIPLGTTTAVHSTSPAARVQLSSTQGLSLFSTATTDGYTRAQLEDTPEHDPFPSAAVGGGVAAAVIVIIVVVVVVVFLFYKRRSQRSDKTKHSAAVESEVHDNSAVTDESGNYASARGPYASLQMSEVGLRSVYSDLAHRSTAAQAQPAHLSDYASLQMSDVGMTSTYSELGKHEGLAPAHDGTDYEIPP